MAQGAIVRTPYPFGSAPFLRMLNADNGHRFHIAAGGSGTLTVCGRTFTDQSEELVGLDYKYVCGQCKSLFRSGRTSFATPSWPTPVDPDRWTF